MTGRRMIAWLGLPLLGLLIVITAWAYVDAMQVKRRVDPALAREDGRPIPVRTELVSSQTVEDIVAATAVTVPSATAMLKVGAGRLVSISAPPAALKLKKLLVHEGDFVRQGQLVCEFEDQDYRAVLAQKKSALDSAQATLERIQEQLKYNSKVRELDLKTAEDEVAFRKEDLQNRQTEQEMFGKLSKTGAASLVQFYDARSQAFQARFDLSKAQATQVRTRNSMTIGTLRDKEDLAKAGSEVLSVRTDWELATREVEGLRIRSPIDGFVSFTNNASGRPTAVAPGMGVAPIVEPAPGQIFVADTTIATVFRQQPVDVLMDYPLERIGEVRPGQTAQLVLDSLPKDTLSGRVLRIGPAVNTDVRVMPVLLRLDDSAGRIRPGITGFVRIRIQKTATTVPNTAVLHQGGKAAVFCVSDGRARLREVAIGRTFSNDAVEITRGLSPGENVVIFQNFYRHMDDLQETDAYLKDGDLVDAQWQQWAGRQ
jgi:multidrug efflux pump subunit AcrA (membrane-fusion protein)